MCCSILVSLVGTILSIVGLIGGVSTSTNLIETLSWSRAELPLEALLDDNRTLVSGVYVPPEIDGIFDVSISLYRSIYRFTATEGENADDYIPESLIVVAWADEQCTLSRYPELCEACSSAATSTQLTVYTGLLAGLAAVTTTILRSQAANDINCQKAQGVFTVAISMLSTLLTLSNFNAACGAELEAETGYKFNAGIGLMCFTMAALLKGVDVLCHLMIPVPSTVDKLGHQRYEPGRINDTELPEQSAALAE